MKFHLSRKAQSTAEYVIVLGLIVAAVLAMQTYIKRGFQGRLKDATDYVDEGGTNVHMFNTGQYEPYYLRSSFQTQQNSDETEDLLTGGGASRKSTETSNRSGFHNIMDTNAAD